MAQPRTFCVQILDEPSTLAVVPWDAVLLGLISMAGQSCLLWTTLEGNSERTKKRRFVFHTTEVGQPVPYDVDFLGHAIGQRDYDGDVQPVDLLIWAPKDVPRR